MTDPWMVQNPDHKNTSVENGTSEDEIQQQHSKEHSQGAPLEFEDNFEPVQATPTGNTSENTPEETPPKRNEKNSNNTSGSLEPLPDSDNYLRGLERKLQKIKKGASLVEALAEKRNDCLRQLLHSGDPDNNNAVLALDEPLNNLEFYRHLQPVQALSVGELVHIVKHDQLQQEQAQETADKQEDTNQEIKKDKKEETQE
ncbi:uncharacterized protein LOC118737871 [Rhagoletis pomonella]|uniref:uncharacterized protein LOC118737871 n=1 Tax=Rhagoletis pomonella TaxID=28610 RepID=UPI00177EEE4A|nr:uncharacterized protein LOC118737871 [Rhagoletis pomonella]